MPDHKFRPGQLVNLNLPVTWAASQGPYEIMQRMPERDGEFQYRIKSHQEDHERVAGESQLTALLSS